MVNTVLVVSRFKGSPVVLKAEAWVRREVLAPWAQCSVAVLLWLWLDAWLCGVDATQPLGPLFSRVHSLCAREAALMWPRHCRGGCPADGGGECWPPFRRLVPIVLLRHRWAPRSEAGGFHPWGCPNSQGKSATLASQGLTLLRAAPPAGTGWVEASREAGLGGHNAGARVTEILSRAVAQAAPLHSEH